MASSLVAGGFVAGLRAVGSNVANGGVVQLPIANSYGTSMFVGDAVKLATDGTIQKVTTSTDKVVGVFVGLNMEGQPNFNAKKYFVAGTSARGTAVLTGLVVTDPNAVFEIQADGSVSAGDLGANFMIVPGTGNAALGISTSKVESSTRSDATGQVKCLGLSPRQDNAWTDAYPVLMVKFNPNFHQMATASVA